MLNKSLKNNDVMHIANIVLNKSLKNNDIMHIANIVLNKAPNNNDATCVGNNVHLTAIGTNNPQWRLYSHYAEKPTYQR